MGKQNAAQKLAIELTALAKAATPGPWITDGDYVNEHNNVLYSYIASGRKRGGRIANTFANCLVKTDEQCQANAAFIVGANPKAVLVLTGEIDRLRILAQTEIDKASESAKEVMGARMTLHSLQRDRDALREDAELFRWLADQCGEEFKVDVTGIKADVEEVRWALGYEGETDLRQAVRSAMIEDEQVATPSTESENVSRHEI